MICKLYYKYKNISKLLVSELSQRPKVSDTSAIVITTVKEVKQLLAHPCKQNVYQFINIQLEVASSLR